MLVTVYDLRTHLLEWCGGASDDRATRMANRAVQECIRIMASARQWSYYRSVGRITADASYNTGTITFDLTGGTSERLLTLASGTWPTNAAYGSVYIAGYIYKVEQRLSATTVTLTADSCPAADVAAGTSYTWWRDSYPLPANCVSVGVVQESQYGFTPCPVGIQEWLDCQRLTNYTGEPTRYCIAQDVNYDGRMAIRFNPPPSAAYIFDYVYNRRIAQPQILESTAGTISLTSGSKTVTGSGTAFTQSMVGQVLRLGTALLTPTDWAGATPFAFEGVILSVASSTSATLKVAADANYSALKYRISSLLDMEDGAMSAAFYRCAEWQLARLLNRDDSGQLEGSYGRALMAAKEADYRSMEQIRERLPLQIKSMAQEAY